MESISVKASCANCKCKGKLYKRENKVILIPTVKLLFQDEDEEKEANSERYEKGFLAPHGFATAMQIVNFLIWGSLFWVTIMLVANYVGFEKNRFKAGSDRIASGNIKTALLNSTGISAPLRCTIAAISKARITATSISHYLRKSKTRHVSSLWRCFPPLKARRMRISACFPSISTKAFARISASARIFPTTWMKTSISFPKWVFLHLQTSTINRKIRNAKVSACLHRT